MPNIILHFTLYLRFPSTILKFLQVFLKLAFFPLSFDICSGWHLLITKFSIFLNSTCSLLAIFLKFTFNQKEKRGLVWSKVFDILFQKHLIFYSEKDVIPENDYSVPEFSFLFFANFFIACQLSKIYLQLERKESLYLAQNFRIFIFRKKSCY